MKENGIKYIGFYDLPGNKGRGRNCSLAATNKMDYVCSAIVRAGYKVHIISPSWIINGNRRRFEKQHTARVDDNVSVTFCPSWKTNKKIAHYGKIICSLIWLFSYLILNARKNEKILVYHSPWLSVPVTTARLLKKFEVILEVEEIYSDVSVIHPSFIFLERNLLFSADSYIYSTELLRNRINTSKPHLILYGAYKTERPESLPDNDGKIHLLYAGIIDSHKKGAFNAVESTKYLPVQYVLHVIGFGETDKLRKRISELNPTNKCMVMYEGIKNGSDYVSFCQKCHIGLSTQSMEGTYSGSSFPSKILSYLSLGLRVVSCRIECIVKSSIENLLTYYNTDSPQEIARAIMSVDVNEPYDSRAKIQQLDGEFVSALSKLLKGNGR